MKVEWITSDIKINSSGRDKSKRGFAVLEVEKTLLGGVFDQKFAPPLFVSNMPEHGNFEIQRSTDKFVLLVSELDTLVPERRIHVGVGETLSVGELGYLRDVCPYKIPEDINLRAGLTVHQSWWSSYPPHKFEQDAILYGNGFDDFEEYFVYLTRPAGGWGIQCEFLSAGEKHVGIVRDRDIRRIPLCSHPVVSSPVHDFAYFWFYVNGDEKFNEGKWV